MVCYSELCYLMQDTAVVILENVLQKDWQYCTDNEINLLMRFQFSAARQRQLLSAWVKGDDQYRPSYDMVQPTARGDLWRNLMHSMTLLISTSIIYVRYQKNYIV